MPIWLELLVLALLAYAAGLALGWALWSRSATAESEGESAE
jgi:DNA-binding transcriptional regulator of glucitol operon